MQSSQSVTFESLDPALLDLVNRDRVEVMELLAPPPDRRHQVRGLQGREVLRDRLAGHVAVPTKVPEGLAVLRS